MLSLKISSDLRQRIASGGPGEMLDVVVELSNPGPEAASEVENARGIVSRGERIAAEKQRFVEQATPVQELVSSLGGEVVEHAWINKTLRARIPAEQIEHLINAPGVGAVDVPHRLTRD
jgi:hypothetical protein